MAQPPTRNGSGSRLALIPSLRLRHGELVAQAGPPRTPEEEVRRFEEAGAAWVQLVDLDAALGERNQWPRFARLMEGRLRVQFGGGVRSMTQIQQLLDLGVERVVVSTQAVRNPLWARELGIIFPGRVVLGLDAQGRDLVVEGRTEDTGLDVVETARQLDDAGLAAFLYTDVGGRPDLDLVAELRLAAPRTPLLVGGNVGLEDLDRLEEMGAAAAVMDPDGPGAGPDLAEAVRRHPPAPLRPVLQVLRAREEATSWPPGAGMAGGGEEE